MKDPILKNKIEGAQRIAVLGHIHTRSLREKLYGVDIIEAFDFHNKRNYISAYSASKAVKRAVFGIDIKRRCFFAVERTKSDHISSPTFQIYIRGSDFGHIITKL